MGIDGRFFSRVLGLFFGLVVLMGSLSPAQAATAADPFKVGNQGWAGDQWGTTAMPTLGLPAPEFHLPDPQGHFRSLNDWRGEWVVLYFYPRDFTSGCTLEARRFQQDLPRYAALNAQVVGISTDSVQSHERFCASEGLTFPLLSDPEGEVSRSYGSWLGDKALRNTFLIDPDGILRVVFPIVSPTQHSAEVLAQLKQLTGSVSRSQEPDLIGQF